MADESTTPAAPSARQTELLEAAYSYVLEHGLAELSLRPLAAAIGSSPRVLLFLFGSKEGLVRALLGRARADEVAMLERLAARTAGTPIGLVPAVREVWAWLAAADHRALLRLWAEAYGRSLVDPGGVWSGFAAATVEDWLRLLASCQPPRERNSKRGLARRTVALAVLRGALLDLLATDDDQRVSAAVRHQAELLSATGR
ncbi:TetR/AcrR family transcriptional regulator [Nocardioides panacisoli]|uniref:TetR family transcriptional regulator n=1 Tax=Nocardioides panacisoli TaxID=627624 RepID=A0ABP7IHT1_9ACTN